MQLKATVNKMAKEKNISAQLVLQSYMMERFLERISLSKYREDFILKGGFLIASVVGINSRATMDIDATVKNIPVNEKSIKEIFLQIIEIEINDDINFEFLSINEIRETDGYLGYRVSLVSNYQKLRVPLKLDLTTGDKITPKEINYSLKSLFGNREFSVLAYNLETILAEKLETIISRGDQSTRPRDYYDVYILQKLQFSNIDLDILKLALKETAQKRGTLQIMQDYFRIVNVVKESKIMQKYWANYQKSYEYAKDVSFENACDSVILFMDKTIS